MNQSQGPQQQGNFQPQQQQPQGYYPPQQQPPKKKKKHTVLIIVLVLVGLGILGAIFGGDDTDKDSGTTNAETKTTADAKQSETSTEKATEPAEKNVFSLNETADINGFKMTAVEFRESHGTEFSKPEDGKVFVIVDFEINNESEKDEHISSILNFECYVDGYSTNESLSGGVTEKTKTLDGDIAAGKKLKGSIALEAPEDWKEIEIIYEPTSLLTSNKYTFKVTK